MLERKGIVLAGGSGTRLYPITKGTSKQLLPLYDKPMILYPISVLMYAGIREIAIITTPNDIDNFQRLLGDGSDLGVQFEYIVQNSPDGLAQAYLLAEEFLAGAPSAMILGDNIFYGHGLPSLLDTASSKLVGGSVFGYHVTDPSRYGVVSFDEQGNVRAVEEKPVVPKSNYAVTGLYFLDGTASEKAKTVEPSDRGELEITSLLECYLEEGTLDVRLMGRGYAWFDTGTHDSLLDAGNFVRTLQKRQGMLIGSPEEIAYQKGWVSTEQLREIVLRNKYEKSDYGQFLLKICEEETSL